MTRTYANALIAALTLVLLALVVVLVVGCGGDDPETSDACAEATAALAEFDSDPSTPDNIEPAIEDMALFNEAYERAEAVCA